MVSKRKFNRIKKENPESRIGQRTWEGQKVRNELFKTIKKAQKKGETHPYIESYRKQLDLGEELKDTQINKDMMKEKIGKLEQEKTVLEGEKQGYAKTIDRLKKYNTNNILPTFESYEPIGKIGGKKLIKAFDGGKSFILQDGVIIQEFPGKIEKTEIINGNLVIITDNFALFVNGLYLGTILDLEKGGKYKLTGRRYVDLSINKRCTLPPDHTTERMGDFYILKSGKLCYVAKNYLPGNKKWIVVVEGEGVFGPFYDAWGIEEKEGKIGFNVRAKNKRGWCSLDSFDRNNDYFRTHDFLDWINLDPSDMNNGEVGVYASAEDCGIKFGQIPPLGIQN